MSKSITTPRPSNGGDKFAVLCWTRGQGYFGIAVIATLLQLACPVIYILSRPHGHGLDGRDISLGLGAFLLLLTWLFGGLGLLFNGNQSGRFAVVLLISLVAAMGLVIVSQFDIFLRSDY